jgi:hypothetical protein
MRDASISAVSLHRSKPGAQTQAPASRPLASQVSLLMKEAEALADSVAKMRRVRDRAEARLEPRKAAPG